MVKKKKIIPSFCVLYLTSQIGAYFIILCPFLLRGAEEFS